MPIYIPSAAEEFPRALLFLRDGKHLYLPGFPDSKARSFPDQTPQNGMGNVAVLCPETQEGDSV